VSQTPDTDRPAIAAAVIVHEGKVLLVRRKESEGALTWQLPAGAIEDGETAEQAAVREASEETTVSVSAEEVLGDRVHPATGRLMVLCRVQARRRRTPASVTQTSSLKSGGLVGLSYRSLYPMVSMAPWSSTSLKADPVGWRSGKIDCGNVYDCCG